MRSLCLSVVGLSLPPGLSTYHTNLYTRVSLLLYPSPLYVFYNILSIYFLIVKLGLGVIIWFHVASAFLHRDLVHMPPFADQTSVPSWISDDPLLDCARNLQYSE